MQFWEVALFASKRLQSTFSEIFPNGAALKDESVGDGSEGKISKNDDDVFSNCTTTDS